MCSVGLLALDGKVRESEVVIRLNLMMEQQLQFYSNVLIQYSLLFQLVTVLATEYRVGISRLAASGFGTAQNHFTISFPKPRALVHLPGKFTSLVLNP
jgi:hypothetical protein